MRGTVNHIAIAQAKKVKDALIHKDLANGVSFKQAQRHCDIALFQDGTHVRTTRYICHVIKCIIIQSNSSHVSNFIMYD